MLGTLTSMYLPYIETVNYRHDQKSVFFDKRKKKERLIMNGCNINLSSKKAKSGQD
jgi:hypothetical protein